MNTTVYTAFKAPIAQHPQKCRIGVCDGTPILDDGWVLYSSLITENADRICSEVTKSLNEVRETNYDAESDAWMITVACLDKWMTSSEELIQISSSNKHPMQYFRHYDDAEGFPRMDYVDFIDSPAVRDHLRKLPPLPPAQQCILIAQSDIRPLEDKLAALREIRGIASPEDFAHGCWHFQCEDPFPVILDRYLRTRAERLVKLRKAEPGVIYMAEDADGWCGAPFSTFDAALTSVHKMSWNDGPPSILRRPIDEPGGEILVATLSRNREIVEINAKRYHDPEFGRDLGGELQNGYAHVPHPFKRGDIVRQFGDTYCVLADSAEDANGSSSLGADWSDMRLHGVTWDRRTGTFEHDHNILYTRYGMEFITPADLPEEQRMLAAVSRLLRGEDDLIDFLQRFTCGKREALEKEAVAADKEQANCWIGETGSVDGADVGKGERV